MYALVTNVPRQNEGNLSMCVTNQLLKNIFPLFYYYQSAYNNPLLNIGFTKRAS